MPKPLSIVGLSAAAFIGTAHAEPATGNGWEFKLGGRLQLDYASVDTDQSGGEWSASELRRLRLSVSGKFGDNLKYKVELNTNSSEEVNLEDGYLEFAPGTDWKVKVGQFKTPNSLDEQTSSRFISTLERAAFTDAFEFNRRVGVSVATEGETYTFTAGVFGDNVEADDAQEGHAVAARLTYTPIMPTDTADLLVHIGGSVRYREIGDTQSDLRYRQRPVSHIPGRIISTGRIAQSDMFYGFEAAALYQNVWLAGEYGVTDADCAACASEPSLSGAYVEAGMMFGGRKTYKGGKFNRPIVDHPVTKNGLGALALVARVDTIDLDDSGVDGGSYDAYVIGADWWATKYTRLGLNLFRVEADLGTSTSGLDSRFAGLVTGNVTNEDATGAMLRAQFDF